jgi:hypothetical protein
MGSACTGAYLSERSRAGGRDTQAGLLRELLRRLVPLVAPAGPRLPPVSLARTRGALPPSEHLLHECIINIMDAQWVQHARNEMHFSNESTLFKSLHQYVQISSPVEKYLPNLLNLRYSCSSSVKALTPNNHKNNIT